jgi:hypothetical protein
MGVLMRAQWPHTVEDILKSLDGVWGLVGATGENGNLYRLERSLHEPLVYTLSEYRGNEESEILKKETFDASAKDAAVKAFAKALGFTV